MAIPARDVAYERLLDGLSAYMRVRHRGDLARVERFVLFVGYPRSGGSIVGAILNAHRNAVVSHELDVAPLILSGSGREELFARILARARWFDLRGNRTMYSFDIPGQWQGRFDGLEVVGDKGRTSRYLAANPGLLDRVRSVVEVPLRLIHVVRNPYDNIAAISLRDRPTLEESVEFYFEHCAVTGSLEELADPAQAITVRHEELLADPRTVLRRLCRFLGLDAADGYLEACCAKLFDRPTQTRTKVDWPAGLVGEVERRTGAFPFLAGYEF